MVRIKPFKGLRPKPEYASKVASPPYDVLSSEEAREMAQANPLSFLHVVKPEIDLPPDTDPYSDDVYQKAAENLERLQIDGILKQDATECYYLYQIRMGNHVQTGLVAVASVDDYLDNKIKKHEFTRPAKEDDRTRHILESKAQAGPVFCVFRRDTALTEIFKQITAEKPEIGFTADDSIEHKLWPVCDSSVCDQITSAFAGFNEIYIADGHHRSAAGSRAAEVFRKAKPDYTGDEGFNYFLTVIFPDNELMIMAYNRVLVDLNSMPEEQFMARIDERFEVREVASRNEAEPKKPYNYGMYMNGQWYALTARPELIDPNDPVARLDVHVLSKSVLEPLLGIENPRTDPRIDFVGGIRGLAELEKLVNSGKWKLAFALHPTTVEQLLAVADANKVMPPKSTWFEPKLRSGMVVHRLD